MRQGIRAGNCDRPRAIFHQPRRRNATTASTVSRENRLQIASITRGEYTARFIHRLFTELCSGFCRHAAECTVTEITPAKVLRILTLLVIADGGVSTLAVPSACCTPHGGTKMVSTSRPSGRNSDIRISQQLRSTCARRTGSPTSIVPESMRLTSSRCCPQADSLSAAALRKPPSNCRFGCPQN